MKAVSAIAGSMIKELVRRKDLYVLLILMLVLMAFLGYQNFFDVKGVSRYIKDAGYSLVILFSFIIAVVFTAKQIPSEENSRTIYPLLAKPLSRKTVIIGKFTGGALVSASAFSAFYLIFACFYMASGGEKDPVIIIQGFFLGIFFLCMASAMVILFSTFLTTSANVTISFLIYMIMGGFSGSIRDSALFFKGAAGFLYGFIYYILPHFEFFDIRIRITHSWDPLPAWVFISLFFYTAAYCSVLLYLGGYIFGRKKL